MNPFAIPARPLGDNRPLCPWETPEHEHLYVAVDNTDVAYQEFQKVISQAVAAAPLKKVVMALGKPGCGKTALIHRCVYWLLGVLKDGSVGSETCELIVVDLGHRAAVAGLNVEARIKFVCDRVLDDLELAAVFEPTELAALDKRRENPASVYPYLGQLLRNRTKCLAVILPEIELQEELKRYVGFVSSNILFFGESSSDEVLDSCHVTFGAGSPMPVLELRVGPLTFDDGWLYVQSRMQQLDSGSGGVPTVTQDTVAQLMQVRLSSGHPTSIFEFHRVCLSVFETAIKNAAASVEYVNFLEDYTRRSSG